MRHWSGSRRAARSRPPARPGIGDKLLVRFEINPAGEAEARLIKRLGQSAHRILGVVRKSRGEVMLEPVDRRTRLGVVLVGLDAGKLKDGDLVVAQIIGEAARAYGPKRARCWK